MLSDSDYLEQLVRETPPERLEELLESLPGGLQEQAIAIIQQLLNATGDREAPDNVLDFSKKINPDYRVRPHIQHLSDRLAQAVRDVENGISRHITISMPPRSGKTYTTSTAFPTHLLDIHPDWRMGIISHTPDLASKWGRDIRRNVESYGMGDGGAGLMAAELAKDARAVSHWETTEGGYLVSRSVRQPLAGYGFKVMIVDDPVKDFASAQNPNARDELWNWWKADAYTRLEEPSLCIVIGTRWHEDDLIGRILSDKHEGDPSLWERIVLPAIATEHDVLGRAPGDPLLSPLVKDETPEKALARWQNLHETVGDYTWAALYQQNPLTDESGIYDVTKLRYYTVNPDLVRDDNSVILLDEEMLARWTNGRWVDSWDTTFKGGATSDYVVGQRWVRAGNDRFLVAQQRGRWGYNDTLEKMRVWAQPGEPTRDSTSPWGYAVAKYLVEEKANGAALIESMAKHVNPSKLKAINPKMGKEARARVITPEIERGQVYLPHPADPGNEWVNYLVAELKGFPNVAHDDMNDALTQALKELQDATPGGIAVPHRSGGHSPRASRITARRIPGR